MKYVSEESLEAALAMERKFAALPPDIGVLFASVEPTPIEGGKVLEFAVRIGVTRNVTEATGKILIRRLLTQEMKSGLHIYGAVYRGVSGTARNVVPVSVPEDGCIPT